MVHGTNYGSVVHSLGEAIPRPGSVRQTEVPGFVSGTRLSMLPEELRGGFYVDEGPEISSKELVAWCGGSLAIVATVGYATAKIMKKVLS